MPVNYEPLWYWVKEREAMRLRKEASPMPPFTQDPILATYRFCNVRREDDRVTVWIRRNIREPYADHKYLWFMLCVARQINWPETLHTLISSGNLAWPIDDNFSPRILGEVLEGLAVSGRKVFTGAYIITAPARKGEKKTTFVATHTLGALWSAREKMDRRLASEPKMRWVWEDLLNYKGWGPFLSYQAVVDMRFTQLLSQAPDRATWAAAGPGTIRGLNRLHGRPVDGSLSQGQALQEMLTIYERVTMETGVRMDLSDVPNILCETDKYLRVQNGEGKPRALYVPNRGC
jgi:hypothetical protein